MEPDMLNPGCETLLRGDSPVLVVTPHTGTALPAALREHAGWRPVEGRLADPAGLLFADAARRCGASLIAARYHPCVIDLMVSAEGPGLSVGVDRGGLCRTHTSRGETLYEIDNPLTTKEVDERIEQLWRPFHLAVSDEICRLRSQHEHVVVLVPHASWWLSPFRAESMGRDCNIGTDHGKSCDRELVSVLTDSATTQGRSWVVNGNIADGFAAECYGDPRLGVHVMNVEISGSWRVDCATQVDQAFAELLEDETVSTSRDMGMRTEALTMVPLVKRLERIARGLPATVCVGVGRGDSAHQT
jgi:N-formylglutamate deformylase